LILAHLQVSLRAAIFFLALLSLLAVGHAQVITGTILGTVIDPTGGAVAGATVTVINAGTGVKFPSSSNSSGEFAVPLLPPGTYSVTIESPGFRAFKKSGIPLTLDSKYRVDAKLQVGEVSSAIEVVADAQALQTDSTDLNTTISRQAIEDLPNIGRNAMQFLNTVAGIVPRGTSDSLDLINTGDDSRRQFSNFSVNGSRPNSSEILLDGAPNTNMANNEVSVLPNVDAIGDLKIIANAYSAEFGRVSGGVISFGTKSGTNQYHGSLYENIRNPVFNANSFGNNSFGRTANGDPVNPKGKFNLNQFGGSFSGPVRLPGYNGRTKTFFFVSYEGLRRVADASSWLTVPTALERNGDFTQTVSQVRDPATGGLVLVPQSIYAPFPTTTTTTQVTSTSYRLQRQQFQDGAILNKIPKQYINPVAQRMINYYPLPNSAPRNPDGTQNYFDSNSNRTRTDQIIVKLDQNFSTKHRTFFRFSNDWTLNDPANRFREGNPAVSSALPVTQFNPAVTLGNTWTVSPTSIVEVRANLTRINLVQKPVGGFDFAEMGFSPEMRSVVSTTAFPFIAAFSGYQSMGTGQVVYRDNHNSNYSFTGSYTRLLNKWSIKMGGEYRNILANLYQPGFPGFTFLTNSFTRACAGTGCATIPTLQPQGNATADFLIGNLDGQRGNGQFTTGEPSMALKWAYYGFYSQNDWRATRKLTINLGVRWDYQAPPTDRFNHLAQFDRYGTNLTGTRGTLQFSGVNGVARGQTEKDLNDFGPRVGIAYRANTRTVIRTAYGISFDQITGVGTGSDGFGVAGFNSPAFIRIRPESGLDILERPFNNAFNGGGKVIGPNSKDPRFLGTSIIGIERNAPTPYMQQWNFTIERELPLGINLQVAYVGTKGTRLITMQTVLNNTNSISKATLNAARSEFVRTGINPLNAMVRNPNYGLMPAGNPNLTGPTIAQNLLEVAYPAYGGLNMFNMRTGSSSYQSLQVSARRGFRKGFEVSGNYVWSKNIDYGNHFTVLGPNTQNGGGATSYDLDNMRLDRSVANSDIPHRAVINYVVQLPFGRGRKLGAHTPVLTQAISGWKVSGITTFQAGLPLSITGGAFGRPDIVADPVLPKEYRCFGDGVTRCPLPDGSSIVVPIRRMLYFNPNAFAGRYLEVPRVDGRTGTQFVDDPYWWGTAPRFDPRLRGFGIANLDLSIARDFSLGEQRRLVFRVDAANALNHTRFADSGLTRAMGAINLDAARGKLGVPTSTSFGTSALSDARGPRYLQVSARIVF
jgi:hypothetical protein